MRPCSRRKLTNEKRVFNYSLSATLKIVQCAFGIQNVKFKIFEGPIFCKEEAVNLIVKASVVLHNFIKIRARLFCEGG
jgi:hypothetical protein